MGDYSTLVTPTDHKLNRPTKGYIYVCMCVQQFYIAFPFPHLNIYTNINITNHSGLKVQKTIITMKDSVLLITYIHDLYTRNITEGVLIFHY